MRGYSGGRLPEGVFDTLPDECARKRAIEERILRRFLVCGYDEVQTPVLEYLSLYMEKAGGSREGAIVKTFDDAGRILALRPEFTTPIARLASTRMKDCPRPLRLCYAGVAFDNQHDNPGLRHMEFTQAGVELLGLSGPHADAEVIALAASALETAGLGEYLIDIGQVGFFKGLMEEIGISGELAEELRVAVEQKNMLSMEMLLRSADVSGEALKRIMALPSLYGGPEILQRAMEITKSAKCKAALDDLLQVYTILQGYGLAEKVSLDLGMVHSIDYYTGVIFRGISGYLGAPLLSGGRYDSLMDEWGAPSPATGFALGLERLLEALLRQDGGAKGVMVDIVAAPERYDEREMRAIEALRSQGKRVELFHGGDAEALRRYAAARGARAMILSGGEVVEL